MNEQQVGYRIRKILNDGNVLDAETLARLKVAREQALARHALVAKQPAMRWADNLTGRFGDPMPALARLLVPMLVLVFGLVGIYTWQQAQIAIEIEEIDSGVLSGDLPLDAYLDKGFDAWLKRSLH